MTLKNLKIAHRFAALFAIIFAGFAIYGTWSFKTLNELKVNGPIYQRIVQSKDLIADILPPPNYIIESYLVSLLMMRATPDELKTLIGGLEKLRGDYGVRHEFWLKENLEPALRDEFLNRANKPAQEFYQTAFNKFIPALERGDSLAVDAAFKGLSQHYEMHRTAVDRTVEMSNKRYQADEESAAGTIETSSMVMFAILILSLGTVTLLLVIISRSIIRPLLHAVTVADIVAKGDLTQRIEVKSSDETGQLLQALKDMNQSLATTVAGVRDATDAIATGSKQIALGNSDLSQRTEEQASSLQETASSMEELTSAVKQNADNARQANQLAANASDVAIKGGQVVGDVVQTMASISNSSKKIVDIISVIEGIAFQTNILALNAAVEAARAGEQGRGFAVVAGEVRNLAQRSAAAAKEIKTLIGDSVDKVGAGTKLVDQAGITMNEIVTAVKRVTDLMSEIAAASIEQSAGIEQVNQAITQMDEVTQQNAALVEEAAAAAESMEEQAGLLTETVSMFKLEGGGKHQRVAAKPVLMHKTAPVREATLHLPTARKDRKLTKGKDQNEGDWKEF